MGEDTGGGEPVFGSVDLDAVLDAWPECARVLSLSGEIIHINPAGLEMAESMIMRKLMPAVHHRE